MSQLPPRSTVTFTAILGIGVRSFGCCRIKFSSRWACKGPKAVISVLLSVLLLQRILNEMLTTQMHAVSSKFGANIVSCTWYIARILRKLAFSED